MMKRKSVRFVQAFFALSPSSPPLGFSQQNKTNQKNPPPPLLTHRRRSPSRAYR